MDGKEQPARREVPLLARAGRQEKRLGLEKTRRQRASRARQWSQAQEDQPGGRRTQTEQQRSRGRRRQGRCDGKGGRVCLGKYGAAQAIRE